MPGHWTNWSNIPPYEYKWCSFDGFTLVFSFHPGATPPPYFNYVKNSNFNSTTQESVISEAKHIQRTFGRPPDATIVDSSLWDAANWWEKDGLPQNWSTPHQEVSHWAEYTIPKFLDFVQDAVPSSHVAFRSPPPVFKSCDAPKFMWMCVGHEIVEEMCRCIQKNLNPTTHLLYGKYPLIDYHNIVETEGKTLGDPLRDLYMDDAHPGMKLAKLYMAAVLKWVSGL